MLNVEKVELEDVTGQSLAKNMGTSLDSMLLALDAYIAKLGENKSVSFAEGERTYEIFMLMEEIEFIAKKGLL